MQYLYRQSQYGRYYYNLIGLKVVFSTKFNIIYVHLLFVDILLEVMLVTFLSNKRMILKSISTLVFKQYRSQFISALCAAKLVNIEIYASYLILNSSQVQPRISIRWLKKLPMIENKIFFILNKIIVYVIVYMLYSFRNYINRRLISICTCHYTMTIILK